MKLLWLNVDAFRDAVAHDASKDETALMAATQKPIHVSCLGQTMGKPAWLEKPSWFLIADEDRIISPETQSFTAERMKSTVISLTEDHAPLASRPRAVAADQQPHTSLDKGLASDLSWRGITANVQGDKAWNAQWNKRCQQGIQPLRS